MTNRFSSAAYRSHNARTTIYMAQMYGDLPYGNVAALADIAAKEGANVTQVSQSGFCIDNTAFINAGGAVRFI